MFLIDQTCEEFLRGIEHGEHSSDWADLQRQLENDVSEFESSFKHGTANAAEGHEAGKLKTYPLNNVTFKNKFGVEQTEKDWF